VSAEFSGLARQFREAVRAADTEMEKALKTITAPLRLRLKRHPRLRLEQIAGAVRRYEVTVPSAFRIGVPEMTKSRSAFSIQENRLCPSWMNDLSWNDLRFKEPGIAVMKFSLTLTEGRLRETWEPYAIVSLHALSRYFERTGNRSHDRLLADLAVLVFSDRASPALRGPDSDRTPAGDGFWIGEVIPMKGIDGGTMTRAVRTFHLG
jgi:hypothetical protein